MKLTIIREDGAVYKDGVAYLNLDLSSVPNNVHALQFNDTVNAGWIEFAQDNFGKKEPNQTITALPLWATAALTKWVEQETARLAAEAAALKAAANQPQTTGTQTA